MATDSAADRRAAAHRVLDHYLHTAHRAVLLIDPVRKPIPLDSPGPGVTPEDLPDHDSALAWFERPLVVVSADFAARPAGPLPVTRR